MPIAADRGEHVLHGVHRVRRLPELRATLAAAHFARRARGIVGDPGQIGAAKDDSLPRSARAETSACTGRQGAARCPRASLDAPSVFRLTLVFGCVRAIAPAVASSRPV